MELLLVFLPLLSSLLLLLFGRLFGDYFGPRLASFLIFASLVSAFYLFLKVGFGHQVLHTILFPWFSVSLLDVVWSFYYDSLTVSMLIVVLTISFFVHLYSLDYMAEDPHRSRFFSYLSLFTFFMLILVTSSNFVQLFVGWEGVGVCSYLLISFWFTRKQANKSALKAMVVNRVGDFGLLSAMALIYTVIGSLDFSTVFVLAPSLSGYSIVFLGYSFDFITLVSLFLFFGAVGKSAQLGLHTWLPDAMEGPTPVSALIHAATMVTAGVFLLLRCSPFLEYSSFALSVIAVVGALTALFGATVGLLQNDLKRVIAYSTCSQLGYMTFSCGLSAYPAAVFHLYNHAFFKALLFLSAGAVIHAYADEQDMRRMGGLSKLLPFTYSVMVIGSLSLMGFPFLTGFYSKDLILEAAGSSYQFVSLFAYWLGVVSAFFTAFYSFRLIYLTFLSSPRGFKEVYREVGSHESPVFIAVSLFTLALASIFLGYLSRDFFVGFGTDFWGAALYVLPAHLTFTQSEFLPTVWKLVPVLFSLVGAIFSLFVHYFFFYVLLSFNFSSLGQSIYLFLNRRWFFDLVQNRLIVIPSLRFGYKITFKSIDRGIVEILGPTGLTRLLYALSDSYRSLQSGYLYHYVFLMLFSLSLFFGLIVVGASLNILKVFVVFLSLSFFSPFLFLASRPSS